VSLAEQLEEAEQLARVVGVGEVLGLGRSVRHAKTLGLIAPLEGIQVQHAAANQPIDVHYRHDRMQANDIIK